MNSFHKIVLSCFGWQPLGTSHNQWFHDFLIPANFQSGVTWITAFDITVEWLQEYVTANDHTIKVSPGVRYIHQLIQHAHGGLFPASFSDREREHMRQVGLRMVQDHILTKMQRTYDEVVSEVFTETAADLDAPDNVSFEYGDITSVEDGMIIQGVNCQGAMGSGVARAILNVYPQVYSQYMSTFRTVRPGVGYVDYVLVSDNVVVANCYTQEYFGGDGKRYADLDAVVKCLEQTFEKCSEFDIPLHTPRIASDLGGLSWTYEVYPEIVKMAKQYPYVPVKIWILTRDVLKI